MCAKSPSHVAALVARLKPKPLAELLGEIRSQRRAELKRLWQVAGIDDEDLTLDPWPCWCGQVDGCDHPLNVRLKGMLCRLTERQALTFLACQGWDEETSDKEIARELTGHRDGAAAGDVKPFLDKPPRERSENRLLNWFYALVFDLAPDRCEDFLFWLKIRTIVYLDRLFRPPPEAKRDWYLPDEAMHELLERFPRYADPTRPADPCRALPGKPKVGYLAQRRGQGQAHDSAQARANGRLGAALWHPGDLRECELPADVKRKQERLGNGATVALELEVEEELQQDLAAAELPWRSPRAREVCQLIRTGNYPGLRSQESGVSADIVQFPLTPDSCPLTPDRRSAA